MKKFWIVGLLILSLSFAQISATMEAPSEVIKGERMIVRIMVQNNGPEIELIVRQVVGYEPVYPEPRGVQIPGYITPQHYYWNATLSEGELITFEFAEIVSGVGEYQVPPATVFFEGGSVETNSPIVSIVCDRNGVCDAGESFVNCPADCNSGVSDGFCDEIQDGICDVDCEGLEEVADPDCECGDGVCETNEECIVDCGRRSQATPNFSSLYELIVGILIAGVVLLVIVAASVVFYLKSRDKTRRKKKR